jgi:hypothetical protein
VSGAGSIWTRLVEEIQQARRAPGHARTDVQNAIARRFQALAKDRRCSATAVGWLEARTMAQGRHNIRLMDRADGRDNRARPAVKLRELSHLQDGALLTISVDIDDRRREIIAYSVALHGKLRSGDVPWYARIDLDESPRGQGPCGHPLLHAHVGLGEEGKFSPRAPLPWLHPGEALDWLLATVEPSVELSLAG